MKEILDAREKGKTSEEKSSSDKENDDKSRIPKISDVTKTYSKKTNDQTVLKQKGLSAKNGSLEVNGESDKSGISIKENDVQSIAKAEQAFKTDEGVKEELLDQESSKDKKDIKIMKPWGLCSADRESCIVHSSILPKTYWSFYGTI